MPVDQPVDQLRALHVVLPPVLRAQFHAAGVALVCLEVRKEKEMTPIEHGGGEVPRHSRELEGNFGAATHAAVGAVPSSCGAALVQGSLGRTAVRRLHSGKGVAEGRGVVPDVGDRSLDRFEDPKGVGPRTMLALPPVISRRHEPAGAGTEVMCVFAILVM